MYRPMAKSSLSPNNIIYCAESFITFYPKGIDPCAWQIQRDNGRSTSGQEKKEARRTHACYTGCLLVLKGEGHIVGAIVGDHKDLVLSTLPM